MTAQLFRSTDASAPVLTGSVGTLITVLDAVLVNGYGSKTAAGWTKPFTATNQAAYRNNVTTGTGFYLNVNDTGPGGAGAREARMTGFETMSAVGTGTGQFPLIGQCANGIGSTVVRKSSTADSTARAWYILADETVFTLFIESNDYLSACSVFQFGDIYSYHTNDAYRCLIVGRNNENNGTVNMQETFHLYLNNFNMLYHTCTGHFMARLHTGFGSSLLVGKHSDHTRMGMGQSGNPNSGGGSGDGQFSGISEYINNGAALCNMGNNWGNTTSFQYPNAVDGGLYMAPVWIHHGGFVRGYMKGIWAPQHHLPMNHLDAFSGTGTLSGKSFLTLNIISVNTSRGFGTGQVFIETTDTWS